ncbi:LAFE_0E13168g1_1 [Lachancea fermentati]|uniref:LAFE_0E13168g1_1 n=1 Tax=Lachancea fermentati TaxID=4955 RepID=A0A1G4ME85_LACFM|nr:LAFE_0E13168g1_1 [Lachancea fermentati]
MDFSVPTNLRSDVQAQLQEHIQDYKDGNLTAKGYLKKRQQLLEKNGVVAPVSSLGGNSPSKRFHGRNHSLASTIRSQNFDNMSVSSTVYASQQESPSFYRVTTVNSSSLNTSSPAGSLEFKNEDGTTRYKPMIPLLPRASSAPMSESLPSILRARSQMYEKETAMISISSKGKENYISWEKLYLRAAKVAHELQKNKLYKMDKVLLWYNREEVVEFTVSLMGCFIAGMVAVPVSFETYSLNDVSQIITLTGSKFALISEECLRQLDHLHVSGNSKIKLTKSGFFSQVTYLKTDDLGTYAKARKTTPTFDIPNVCYIEFTRTPLGRLSGVVMKHKILYKQLETMTCILNSRRKSHWKKGDIKRPHKSKKSYSHYVILNSLDPTRSTGLILGVLFNIYSGNLLLTVDDRLLQRSGGYENIINRHRVDILLNDQLQLKQVVINYLENPSLAISKKSKIDFSCIKWCLTSCTTIDTEVTDMIVHKWLKNLGCMDASQCYSPLLTLLDFGGVFISLRDQLGKLDNFPVHNSKLRFQDELFIDKEELKENIVKPSITAMINSSSSTKDYLRVSSFGFPISDATLCIANPDDHTLAPDLTVGEVWISSPSITDEFYQMEKINDFVFKAKLNFKRMFDLWQKTSTENDQNMEQSAERISMIMSVCSPQTNFVRTKLMGFVHNGKIYILSLIEDMFLQNKLIRLPNWSHTSDITRARKSETSSTDLSKNNLKSLKSKRVVQTYYLQHVTENIVRMVDRVSELSVFELPYNKSEHFLIMVVESSLASNSALSPGQTVLVPTAQQKEQAEKKLNGLVEQIYKILWIFHKIQPVCVLVVPPRSLPRRYCSLEIANSTVEKKFLSGELNSKFVKFQFDNVILDFIPHSSYYNESIFSERLSSLRHTAVAERIYTATGASPEITWQTSGIDYREESLDSRTNKNMTTFSNIMEILEWRTKTQGDDFAFSDGGSTNSSGAGGSNNIHSKVSWRSFFAIIGSFVKKIVQSKTPLKRGDHVIVLCDNSVEYVAMVLACFYCNFIVIPISGLHESNPIEEISFLMSVVRNYKVKRIFVDFRMNSLLEDNPAVSKVFKKFRSELPKITVFSKIKKKTDSKQSSFKEYLKEKLGVQANSSPLGQPCVIWIDREVDTCRDINVAMNHTILLNLCKISKETLQLTSDNPIVALCSHTTGLGFVQSCLLGIYVGTTTCLFSQNDVKRDPKDFLIGLQNLNVKDLMLSPDMLYLVLDKANTIINSGKTTLPNKKSSSKTLLRPDFLRSIQNLMIPSRGRPRIQAIQNLLKRYPSIAINATQLNYVYQHIFNPMISLRSYLGIPPVDIYLDPVSLREGMVKEIDPLTVSSAELQKCIHLQDSGMVPVCTDVSIVNPETLQPCYENEIGEIWCCSEANAYDYFMSPIISSLTAEKRAQRAQSSNKVTKDPFISAQFKAKFRQEIDNGLSYLRTGDLGFIKTVRCTDARDNVLNLSLLYVLGSINETVEVLGLTHFVSDLEMTVKAAHACIANCLIAKIGGLLSCLVECRNSRKLEYSNLTPLIVGALLRNNGVVVDLCCFLKPGSLNNLSKDWHQNRVTILSDWLNKKLNLDAQVGVNFGENYSIYLLSEFEKDI